MSIDGGLPERGWYGLGLLYVLGARELNEDNEQRRHYRSDPARLDRERAFLCLRSLHSLMNVDRLAGWHARSPDGWCWTARRFEARIHPAPGD